MNAIMRKEKGGKMMKKVISILLLFLVMATMSTVGNATTTDTLAEELYSIGKPYGLREEDKVRIERYLSDYEVTNEQATKVVEKAKKMVEIFKKADAKSVKELTKSERDEFISISNQIADILGLKLEFNIKTGGKGSTVKIYKDGKLIEIVTLVNSETDKLAYTGNNTNILLVVSSVAVIALLAGIAVRKKFANA